MRNYADILQKLYDLLEIEHGGCDHTTCNIAVAMSYGYDAFAIECFASSGAASDAFYNLYRKLPKRWIDLQSRTQAKELWETVAHEECSCGAIVWDPDQCDSYCSSCSTAKGRQ